MKLKIAKTTTEEVEMQLPIFFRSEVGIVYGMVDENTAISITSTALNHHQYPGIYAQYLSEPGTEMLTPEQFTAIYDELIEKLVAEKSKFFTQKPKS